MPIAGVVRVWHREQGWGVVDSQHTPGGCWLHFSSVLVPGYRELRAGQSVSLDYEATVQDGYSFRATEVWPAGQEPWRAEGETSEETSAFRSTLTITFDDPAEPLSPIQSPESRQPHIGMSGRPATRSACGTPVSSAHGDSAPVRLLASARSRTPPWVLRHLRGGSRPRRAAGCTTMDAPVCRTPARPCHADARADSRRCQHWSRDPLTAARGSSLTSREEDRR